MLTPIINQSLVSGIFPVKLKIAKIVPIFKKGDSHFLENYRPVSLLSSVSKVFEKAVYDQLTLYFNEHDYFNHSQYGFRAGHSTEYANIELVDRISYAVDQGQIPLTLYLDLSKAFDTLDHHILLRKMEYFGICDSNLNWFQSYLSERPRYVNVDNNSSETKVNSLGVPQGSILGPLLFTIYVNDMKNSTNFFELDKVYKWLCLNKLSLNLKKTKFMIFRNIHKKVLVVPLIKVNGTIIRQVTDFDFLGIVINENINWSSHINKISIKLSRAIGMIYRLRQYLPLFVLKVLYYSLVLPHTTYGNIVWNARYDAFYKLQKKSNSCSDE